MVAGAVTKTLLSFYFRLDLSILRPTLRSWRNVLSFGGYTGASYAIDQTYEALPQLVLGHVLPHSAVGLYNRAHVVSDIPDRIVLASATAVAFPALAAAVRQGRSLKSFICELWDILLCSFGRDLSCSRSWPTPPSRFSWVGSGLRSFLCYRSWPSEAWRGSRRR